MMHGQRNVKLSVMHRVRRKPRVSVITTDSAKGIRTGDIRNIIRSFRNTTGSKQNKRFCNQYRRL